MGLDENSEPWVTGVPAGTTDDVIQVLVEAGLIENLGPRTSRQRWKKPLTFALAHGIRTGAIKVEVLEILLEEARRILKGATPKDAEKLRALVVSAYNRKVIANAEDIATNPEIGFGAEENGRNNMDETDNRAYPGQGGTKNE